MSTATIHEEMEKAMSVQKRNRELLNWASTMGIKERRIDPTGSHLLFTGIFGGKPVSTIISKTPGDWRADRNIKSVILRQVREIMGEHFAREAKGHRYVPPNRLDAVAG